MADPVVSVPISSTNLVINQTFTRILASLQGGGLAIAGAVLSDPAAVSSLTKGWPAWVALAAVAGLEFLKSEYFSGSNSATVDLFVKMEAALLRQHAPAAIQTSAQTAAAQTAASQPVPCAPSGLEEPWHPTALNDSDWQVILGNAGAATSAQAGAISPQQPESGAPA